MSLARRSFAALCGLLLLQLSLPGSGTLCAMAHSIGRRDADAHGMDHMTSVRSTAAPDAAVSAMPDANASTRPAGCGHMDMHDGCGLPWAPGQCASMTACAVIAVPAMRSAAAATVRGGRVEVPSPALLQAGPTFAPELPPPRA